MTRYAYHHGFYDGEERAFRGFGRVDQWDSTSVVDIAIRETSFLHEIGHVLGAAEGYSKTSTQELSDVAAAHTVATIPADSEFPTESDFTRPSTVSSVLLSDDGSMRAIREVEGPVWSFDSLVGAAIADTTGVVPYNHGPWDLTAIAAGASRRGLPPGVR